MLTMGTWLSVIPGDEVAIMPTTSSPPSEVLEIQLVIDTGADFIQVLGGRTFNPLGGESLDGTGYLVPATEEHRAALEAKR
jgi:hypothetical protein